MARIGMRHLLAAVRAKFPARDRKPPGRRPGIPIGQIIAALDDRDVRGALALLDPPASGSDTRRIKCVGGCRE
jgi:hypothetical protein